MENAMAPHYSTLAWKIPWMEKPGGLPSMGLHRVRHNWSDLAAAAAAELHWGSFPGGSAVKNPPATPKMCVWSLGREDPLEEGVATHSSILAWRIPWMEEPGGLQSLRLQRVGHDWSNWTHTQSSTETRSGDWEIWQCFPRTHIYLQY